MASNVAVAFLKFERATCHIHSKIKEGSDVDPDLFNLPKVAGKRKKGMSAEQYITGSILFLYDYTGHHPRITEEHGE